MLSRRVFVPLAGALLAVAGLTAPVSAQSLAPLAPYPSCGGSFHLTRSSSSVKVVGTGLNQWSSGYMLVFVSDSYGHGYGPYNASPYGGANFTINTGRTSKQNINVDLTDSSNTYTLCTGTYYV